MKYYVNCEECGREVLAPDVWMSTIPWRAKDHCSHGIKLKDPEFAEAYKEEQKINRLLLNKEQKEAVRELMKLRIYDDKYRLARCMQPINDKVLANENRENYYKIKELKQKLGLLPDGSSEGVAERPPKVVDEGEGE